MADAPDQWFEYECPAQGMDINGVAILFDPLGPEALQAQQIELSNHQQFPNPERRKRAPTPVNGQLREAA